MKTTIKKYVNDDFFYQIIDEHPTLNVVDYSKDCVLAYSTLSNKVHYFYKVNKDVSFHFNLLSDVGQNYQEWFEDVIKENNLNIVQAETDDDYFDKIVL